MENETKKQWLKYTFTDTEKRELAQEMANKTLLVSDLEEEKKSVAAGFTDRIKAAQLAANRAALKLKDGYEMRDIDCEVIKNAEQGLAWTVRLDTGELVQTRELTASERQMHIDEALKQETDEPTDDEIRHQQSVEREMRSEASAL